jgi:hypothetical protein
VKRVLRGVGDPSLGEWWESGRDALHCRRRLSALEQAQVGPVVDVRGTPEARRRAVALGDRILNIPPDILQEELG